MQTPPTIRTTADVQNLLDINQRLINAILENIKIGKNDEAAKYQEKLQQNLIQLAAIADGNGPQRPNS